ncbi:MAG: hypothetical protein ACD_50C00343G0012 [uncultured bacterium]|nr:MAG: hypothetical protein ACD_50C00343G0012 [uncultured bacterium]OGH13258.1 MAG: translation elongation factor Ts [Candidatus Levybacteria bacterium RIFCSPHIGHO2_01_FULL_38_26]
MSNASLEQLKKLRSVTQASISDCRKALEESVGDYSKALLWLKEHGIEKAGKKADRETAQGLVDSYIHQNGKVGVLVSILCETDFVARTSEFKSLVHEIAMQVAAMNPNDIDTLLKQEYIRDSSKTIESLVKEAIAKLGENIVVKDFKRFDI